MKNRPIMKPGHIPFTELLLDVNKFDGLTNLLKGKKVGGGFCKLRKFEYPPKSGKYIACKQLTDPGTEIVTEKSFFREVFITNKVRHPCTVELIAFDFKDLSNLMISTRFYELGSLDNLLMTKKYLKLGNMKIIENPDSSDKVMEVENGTIYTILMYGIARGVRYLHHLKIFHRDLKPENVVIDEYCIPHIADFGLSKENLTENEKQSGVMGTPHYMAPEINDKDKTYSYSFPADIFSLALLFYCLTEGKYYMPDIDYKKLKKNKQKRAAIIRLFLSGEMPEFSITPPNLRNLIERMWSVLPSQRPKIDEVCETLENPKYWFPNTNKEAVMSFKKELDDFESQQIPLILNEAGTYIDQASVLSQNIRYPMKDDDEDKEQNNTKYNYKPQQDLLEFSGLSNNEAECALGITFYTGFKGIPKDYVLAWKYLEEAKEQGNIQADLILKEILSEIKRIELQNTNLKISRNTNSSQEISIDDKVFSSLKSMQAQLLMGMVKEAKGQTTEALNLYTKSAKQGSIAAKGRLGSLLLKKNLMLDQAEILLVQASNWKSDDGIGNDLIDYDERKIALFQLGLLKMKLKSFDDAIEIFEYLLDENHPDAAICLAIAYHNKEEYSKAKEYYEAALTRFSNESAKPYYNYFKNLLLDDV